MAIWCPCRIPATLFPNGDSMEPPSSSSSSSGGAGTTPGSPATGIGYLRSAKAVQTSDRPSSVCLVNDSKGGAWVNPFDRGWGWWSDIANWRKALQHVTTSRIHAQFPIASRQISCPMIFHLHMTVCRAYSFRFISCKVGRRLTPPWTNMKSKTARGNWTSNRLTHIFPLFYYYI